MSIPIRPATTIAIIIFIVLVNDPPTLADLQNIQAVINQIITALGQ